MNVKCCVASYQRIFTGISNAWIISQRPNTKKSINLVVRREDFRLNQVRNKTTPSEDTSIQNKRIPYVNPKFKPERGGKLLLRRHAAKSAEFNEHIRMAKVHGSSKCDGNLTNSKNMFKQSHITVNTSGIIKGEASKKTVDDALVDWIVQGMHPLSEVERPSFIKLWLTLTNHKLMCRKTLVKKIDEEFEEMKANLVAELAAVESVCTTADCWSVYNRSFLGMTIHWIDPATLKRKSAALSCRRIVGKHTFDVLAKEIYDVLVSFYVQNKVCLSITDSGSNFLKAFRDYGKTEPEHAEEAGDDEEVVQIPINAILEDEEGCSEAISLPPHRRCSAHILNLVGHTDIETAMSTPGYKKIARSTFAKCQALWNKSKQSCKAADVMKEHLGSYLIVPNATRWNSTYKSVSWLCKFLNEGDERLHQVCDKVGLSRLQSTEIDFLKEYCRVMEPLAKALDILQGDKNISIGYLLPTLHRLLFFMEKQLGSNLKFCKPLASAIKDAVHTRFRDDLWNKDLVLAACLHPRFKLAWIENKEKEDEARGWLSELVPLDVQEDEEIEKEEQEPKDTFGFFNFPKETSQKKISFKDELESYLREELKDFSSIEGYPILKTFSVKLNTAVPSSATVERLFSCGGNICTPKRSKLTDANFEHQILLKFNKMN